MKVFVNVSFVQSIMLVKRKKAEPAACCVSSTHPCSMQLLVCMSLGIKASDSQHPGCLYYIVAAEARTCASCCFFFSEGEKDWSSGSSRTLSVAYRRQLKPRICVCTLFSAEKWKNLEHSLCCQTRQRTCCHMLETLRHLVTAFHEFWGQRLETWQFERRPNREYADNVWCRSMQ